MWTVQDLLFILCIVLSNVTRAAGVIHVFGYVGRDVNVSCSYDQGYESNEKYLCKNDCRDSDVLIMTSEPKKNKYSIYDDKKKQTFTVTISDLQSMDAGKYWCGVERTGKDIYTEVKLELEQDHCCNNVDKIQSHERGSVSIICPYDSEYQNNLKFICRGNQPSTCLQQAVITSDSKLNGRFTLTDDKESRRFTVNITNLNQEDSGSYLCGVHRNSGLDVFSAVELEVKASPQETITVEPVTSHSTYSTPTHNKDMTLLVYTLPAVVAALLILTSVLIIVFKNIMNSAEAGVEMRPNDIYVCAEAAYLDADSSVPQSTVRQEMNTDEDQQCTYQNFIPATDMYCS